MKTPLLITLLIGALLALANCGGGTGGTGATNGSTTAVSIGVMTKGSIIVNGVHFDDSTASIRIDDRAGTSAELQSGMVVKVRGQINDDRINGVAQQVKVENEVRGTVQTHDPAAVPPSFTVIGQTVLVDDLTVFANFSSPTITPSAAVAALDDGTSVVEVHGLRDSAGKIHASRVELVAPGVNTDELLISQPDTGEQALEIAETLVRSNAVDVIVIDSVAALVPRAELDGDMGDSLPGLQARLMSQALRKLTAAISRSGCVVIFINQIREKIGVMFGSPETTTGGRALKFYASIRLDIRRQEAIKQGTESLGVRTKVKVVKNKLAPPFREAEFDVLYGEGISKSGSVLDAGVEQGLIEKSGTWYTYKNERIGQGRENAKKWLLENPATLVDLESKLRDSLGLRPAIPIK